MKANRFVFILLAIVMATVMIACAQKETTKDGHITLQYIYYETEDGALFFEEDSLGIDHFELNGNKFSGPPYSIYNLPGNQYYDYTIEAYDAEGTLMASGSGQWMVVEDFTTTQTAIITVRHQHSFKDTWSSDATDHWHGTSCGHSPKKDKSQHTFEGDVCTICGYDNHVHTFSDTWTSDNYNHWHATLCGHPNKADQASHTFGSDTVVKEPMCTEDGQGSHTCTICEATVVYTIPKIGEHTFNDDSVCTVCGLHETTGYYVFYDKGEYSDGWRYLEAAPADLRVVNKTPIVDSSAFGYSSATVKYSFGYYRTSASGSNLFVNGTTTYDSSNCTGDGVGTGKNNTQLLVSAMGTESYSSASGTDTDKYYAAKLCNDLTYTVGTVTYDDWFLPSKEELNLMYVKLYKNGLGNFANNTYLSSSEASNDVKCVWFQDFNANGRQIFNRRDYLYTGRVRPVRAF